MRASVVLPTLLVLWAGIGTSPARADQTKPAELGMMLDVGVPDGVSGSAVYRPIRQVRLHAGLGHNLVSPGVRAGVSLRPLPYRVSPTVALEGGRFWQADAGFMARAFGPDLGDVDLNQVQLGYDYVNAHVGFDIGSDKTAFYMQFGVSSLWAEVDYSVSVERANKADIHEDGRWETRVTTPSGRLGLMVFF